ncbi:MAG: PilZ domain-containing protein [Terriglobales bacterium]
MKVFVADDPSRAQQSACTLDVAGRGARVSGIKFPSQAGETVVVERGKLRARFMVAWAGQPGTSREGQLGLIAIDPVLGLWGIETAPPDGGAEMEPDSGLPPPLPPASAGAAAAAPSRALMRFACKGEVEFRKEAHFSLSTKAKLRDIGARGCFVMTKEKFLLNTRIILLLKIGDLEFEVRAAVKTTEALGMWMEWVDLPEAQRNQIHDLVDRLAG